MTFISLRSVHLFFGSPFVKRFALCYRSIVCLSCLSVCNVGVLWPNGWMDEGETWHGGRPWPCPHCFRWGPSSPSPKGYSLPQFSAHGCCGQTAGWIKIPLRREVGLGQGDIVLDGDPASPNHGHMLLMGTLQKGGHSSQFSAYVYCGQTVAHINYC